MNPAIAFLQQGVDSLLPYYEPDSGLLNDPLFGSPTQYSTPYYAWCNAVLAARLEGDEGAAYAGRARRGLRAALDYLLAPELPPYPSDFQRDNGTTSGRNHRDFFWPAVMKTWRLLAKPGEGEDQHGYAQFGELIARVDPLAAFAQRPPSNWAAVWLVGEWARFRNGLSPFSLEQFDDWLGAFFQGHILLDRGFYQEPGHPNSYDLFTRVHLADILQDGYQGRWLPQMETLLLTGLRRSLAVQLSDGALASAHRSTGMSWTDGAQIAFFTHAANYFSRRHARRSGRDNYLVSAAREAALRAYRSLLRWQRPGGIFSPVYNCLPAEQRVGYEIYTADGHYSSLALGFLASAVQNGFDPSTAPALRLRSPQAFIENDPLWRALLHHGETSLQVNAFPAQHYDGFGITDLTFGPDRWLQFGSSAHYLETGQFFNPGLALRAAPGLSALASPLGDAPALCEPLKTGDAPASLRLVARPRGAWYTYTLDVRLEASAALIREATPGRPGLRTLLVPFLRDPGTGQQTRATPAPGRLELSLGDETLAIEWDGPAERVIVLSTGYESRRGLCSLARIDLAEPGDEMKYVIRKIK